MRLVGETCIHVKYGEPSRNEYGALIPGARIETPIHGCVIIPRSSEVFQDGGNSWSLASKEVTILTPTVQPGINEGDFMHVRGEDWEVIAPTFNHVSMFATGRGGTEVQCRLREVT